MNRYKLTHVSQSWPTLHAIYVAKTSPSTLVRIKSVSEYDTHTYVSAEYLSIDSRGFVWNGGTAVPKNHIGSHIGSPWDYFKAHFHEQI